MTSEKRARQKANRAERVAAAEAAEHRARARGRMFVYGGGLLAVIAAVVLIAVLTNEDNGSSDTETADGDAAAAADSTTDDTVPDSAADAETTEAPIALESGVIAPEPGGAIEGATECPATDGSSERITSFAEAPPMCIDPETAYSAAVDTTYGTFTVDLDAAAAPLTVNNFVVLARYGYYEGVPFHRIIPSFVIQGGDAVGNPLGTGGPGYAFDDELPAEGGYEVGSLAMANSGPNTNGSQFFVITGDQGVSLPPLYSLFGAVTDGLDVVLEIEGTETTPSDAPTDSIVINSVTITEG